MTTDPTSTKLDEATLNAITQTVAAAATLALLTQMAIGASGIEATRAVRNLLVSELGVPFGAAIVATALAVAEVATKLGHVDERTAANLAKVVEARLRAEN
jgi:hypothetical protein